MSKDNTPKKFRSQLWFDNPDNPGMTALYIERYLNYGLTAEEIGSGKPIIGIAQTGSDLSPCNRIHIDLAQRLRDGIYQSGGIPLEFPVHPIQETGKRPTAALDRNLAYLGLVEILFGYPIDAVVLTTGCDKTTPACLMAAATVDIPAIVLSGGPMLDGYYRNKQVGSGKVVWDSRLELSAGKITYDEFMEAVCSSAPSPGHCNTMGTASTMNSLAEALGMSLPGCANIPAPYRERRQMAFKTGKRIVEMAHEDLKPSDVMTKEAFDNAIVVNSAIGGSTNAQPHITAIAKHIGIDIEPSAWQVKGYDIPLLVNVQPAGHHLCEAFHRAGGTRAVMAELAKHNKIHQDIITVSGESVAENLNDIAIIDHDVIYPYDKPMKNRAGFLVLSGNLFDSAIMKTSVISDSFAQHYIKDGILEGRAMVFEGSEDYHARIDDPKLNLDEHSILVIRGAGPIGWPGSAEVVNMQPPDYLIKKGILELPCIGDGRQSGTSGSPSILNASPESAVGGGLGLLKSGDMIRIDLNKGRADMIVDDTELAQRRKDWKPDYPPHQTPWQEIHRQTVTQLSEGACIDLATDYQKVASKHIPRNNH